MPAHLLCQHQRGQRPQLRITLLAGALLQHLHLRLQHVAVRCGRGSARRCGGQHVGGDVWSLLPPPLFAGLRGGHRTLATALPRSSAYTGELGPQQRSARRSTPRPAPPPANRLLRRVSFTPLFAQVVADGEFAQLEQHSRHGSAHPTSCHRSGTEGMN